MVQYRKTLVVDPHVSIAKKAKSEKRGVMIQETSDEKQPKKWNVDGVLKVKWKKHTSKSKSKKPKQNFEPIVNKEEVILETEDELSNNEV